MTGPLCRFCSYEFEGGGREYVPKILLHVAEQHAVEMMNLLVRLPIEPIGGQRTELAYEETTKGAIRPINPSVEREERLLFPELDDDDFWNSDYRGRDDG